MKIIEAIINRGHLYRPRFALRREGDVWKVTFGGQESSFRHELGALYIAYLLGEPRKPIHGVALALNAREKLSQPANPTEMLQQRVMGLEDAEAVRALWRRQRELEQVLADRLEIEPVKAEVQRELEEITEHLRQSPWLTRRGAERCARAVAAAIQRLYFHLAGAVDAEGRPDEALRGFARHLSEHLLIPSGRGAARKRDGAWAPVGCFIYVPPQPVVWVVQGLRSGGHRPALPPRCAAEDYLSRFLCVAVAVTLLATGCAGPRPLKGGKAVVTRTPGGSVQQTLTQSENPAQATKQEQESMKVRTYTVPAGSRMETGPATSVAPASSTPAAGGGQECPRSSAPPSTLNSQPSTSYVLSAPMPVVEREETRARTELGAAQKDTARELGAKLASLKGIVWVGVGLFVFGLAALVWPPLKVVIGSVTTSAALMLGGVALMVLPSLVVGNELLILGVVALAVISWCLAHRHGHLRGLVAASSGTPPTETGAT